MEKHQDPHADPYSKTVFGFWLYLLTDFVLFATVLATYFVLRNSTFGGPSACQLLPLSFTLLQSLLLLTCALTAGISNVCAHLQKKGSTCFWLVLTMVLGALFLWMEIAGFLSLVQAGNGWDRSAFLSAYFTLIGTHAAHMLFACFWTLLFFGYVWREGFTPVCLQRATCLRLFWQFLAMIWVGIMTMVYLMGFS